jgi:Mrp family chromosome partitioning ATPase
MSALDQAFIKAYAKDSTASDAPVAVATLPARAATRPAARAGAYQVEQLYHEGALYRVETPHSGTASAAVPQPHIALLPPTSPRRTVRRSILRLLASQAAAAPQDLLPDSPPRVARKVIIRHISHSTAPASVGRLRATLTQSFDPEPMVPASDSASSHVSADLPPETIADEPPADTSAPSTSQPATVAPLSVPDTAPLNLSLGEQLEFAVQGFWEQGQAAPATLVVADSLHFPGMAAMPLVTVSLDSLIAAEDALREHRTAERAVAAYEPAMTRFAGKALDDRDAQPVFRVDAEHAPAIHRPHARFRPASEAEQSAAAESTYIEAEAIEEEIVNAGSAATATPSELSFADPVTETDPDNLTLRETGREADSSPPSTQESTATTTRQAAPLWEIDRFQWPKTCQKLLDDDAGYLQHAGNRLLAAVQDGLKVLAITGSRRGEGRSTLALCLARVAAGAGIQVALMDADFARPQLASKIGLEIAFGWQDAALGKIPLSEAAVKSLADHITVLPLETSAAGRSLSLADPRVTATIRAAAATFELVILDLGPMGPGEELAFPPGERCPLDAAIVVRDLRFATATESEAIGHGLQDAGVEAVGFAENFVVEDETTVSSFNA